MTLDEAGDVSRIAHELLEGQQVTLDRSNIAQQQKLRLRRRQLWKVHVRKQLAQHQQAGHKHGRVAEQLGQRGGSDVRAASCDVRQQGRQLRQSALHLLHVLAQLVSRYYSDEASLICLAPQRVALPQVERKRPGRQWPLRGVAGRGWRGTGSGAVATAGRPQRANSSSIRGSTEP